MDPVTDSGGRVTRSLRKRISSVDGENSSRPGTPIPTKLTAITEIISSPSRPTRITRRNSTSGVATPVKTPAKRSGITPSIIAESTETVTPARRNTRRRSISINENDTETPLTLKASVFEAVAEEVAPTTFRLTRSQSKSPDQIKAISSAEKIEEHIAKSPECIKSGEKLIKTQTQKRRKPGPKSKTRLSLEETEDLSDVDVILVEKEETNENQPIINVTTIDLLDCDDDPIELDTNNLSVDKSETKNEETVKSENSPQNSTTSKDELKNSNFHITSVTNVINKKIMIECSNEHQQLDNSKLCNDESPKEKCEPFRCNDSPKNISSDTKLVNLNIHKTDPIFQIDKNVTIIDLMDCDDESQEFSCTKGTEENKTTTISSDSSSKSILPESHLENDKETHAIATNESILDVEMENEPEETPTMESLSVINENLLNKSNPERTATNDKEIDANESKNKEESVNNLQEKGYLPKIKFDDENEIRSNDIKNIPIQINTALIPLTVDSTIDPKPCQNQVINNFLENDMNDTTPQRKSTATIIEVININSTLTPTQVISSKKVEFFSSPSGDNTIKSVYPKTPATKFKTKSLIVMDSSRDETNNTVLNSNNTTIGGIRECPKDDICEMEIDEHEVVEDQKQTIIQCEKNTPRVLKNEQLKNDQSSTPKVVNVSENKYGSHELPNDEVIKSNTKLLEESCGIDKANDEKSNERVSENPDKISSPNETENQLKWINPSVKGYANEGCKLDAVVKQSKTPKKSLINNDNVINDEDEINNAKIFESESSDEEKQLEDEEEEVELAPGERPYKRYHVFHDDEALEVDDYESGDSMNSEERREILENEVQLDGESIGGTTTDDENDGYVEGEDSENDSFIVSDNEEEKSVPLESSDSDDEDDAIDNNDRRKKKIYKRIQQPTEDSSSSDEQENEETEMKTKSNNGTTPTKMYSSIQKSSSNDFDVSKLSDTALRLQCTAESESEELKENKASISRKKILRKLNQSDRFNKSVRDLNPEVDNSSIEHNEREQSIKLLTEVDGNISVCQNDAQMSMSKENEKNEYGGQDIDDDNEEKSCADADKDSSLSSSVENVETTHTRDRGFESHLGEVSGTTESDGYKENNKNQSSSNRMPSGGGGLSVSFGNFKKSDKHSIDRRDWQRSFTIGVSVKGSDLGTAVTENKSTIENTSLSPTLSNVEQDNELSSDDVRYLEKIRHMPLPLGNPLVRARRQSLALPSNPDNEIFSSSYCGGTSKKPKRSLGILSTNEFNQSQSFIDSMQLRKNEFVRQSAKRKRLSKSFCGASDTLDNSVIDIDVGHLHKRSKLALENSITENYHDSIENINTCKLSSKDAISSTPCEKECKKDSNNNLQRILSRCDEILEAANRAKLEVKINNKKSKVKLPKRNRKKTLQRPAHEELRVDDEIKTFAKKKKPNDKVRAAALAQALIAADDVILGKNKHKHLRTGDLGEEDEEDSKRLSSDVLGAISENVKKNNRKDVPNEKQKKLRNRVTVMTTAGKFLEMPQTPEKKKKKRSETIQLPTGTIFVEPVTPKKRSVLACNGTEFHESPITPFAVGFKVSHIPSDEHKHASILKDRKRKRNFEDRTRHTLAKPLWTKSGVFIEEEFSTMRRIAKSDFTNDEKSAYCNFKQQALMRGDIKRCTTREILQLKERRQMQNQF